MRRPCYALLLGLASIAAAPAHAALFVYSAPLDGSQESPAVVTPGTGFTAVTYDDILHSLRIETSFSGLMGNTTASHIHIRPDLATANGGVATQIPSFPGFPLGVKEGAYDATFNLLMASSWNPAFLNANGGTPEGAEAAFLAGLNGGRAYLNVHSNMFPSGEIRGNLNAIPEPSGWAMMIVGFSMAGVILRRSRRTPSLV